MLGTIQPIQVCAADDVTIRLSGSLTNNGPADGVWTIGGVQLVNNNAGTPVADFADFGAAPNFYPAGTVLDFALEATVPLADLQSGAIDATLAIELAHLGAKSWEISDFTAEYEVQCAPQPSLSLVKSSDATEITEVGQVVNYYFDVTNTGNIDVTDIVVNEGSFSGAGELSPVICPADAEVLEPEEAVTCSANYTVVSDDLTGEPLNNSATASGASTAGPVESAPSESGVPTASGGELAKTGGDSQLGYAAAILLVMGGAALAIGRRKQLS